QGVDANGVAITEASQVQASISSQIQSTWGTNFLVTADNVTIRGLELLGNTGAGQDYVNKVVEVVADGFLLEASVVGAVDLEDLFNAPEGDLILASAVYINDEHASGDEDWVSQIGSY